MKKIVSAPYAGLGNRMRALSSSISIAKELNAYLDVYWIKEKDFPVYFEDLFEDFHDDRIKIKKLNKLNLILTPIVKKNLYIPNILRKFFFDIVINDFNVKDGNIYDFINTKKNNMYLKSCHSMTTHYNLNEIFIPKIEIQKKINKVKQYFNENTIGIHIRRTDNLFAIKNNSIEDFVNKINHEISLNSKSNFFLATDELEVKNYFKNIFGKKIITYDSVLNRNSLIGVQDAVIELWSLSSTKKIIGSHYSSYSEIAAEIGNIKLIII